VRACRGVELFSSLLPTACALLLPRQCGTIAEVGARSAWQVGLRPQPLKKVEPSDERNPDLRPHPALRALSRQRVEVGGKLLSFEGANTGDVNIGVDGRRGRPAGE
jgi:hypothetical protein